MKEKPLHQQWLDRSRSNLERARIEKFSRHILYEDMCFDCQQSAEKALKALLVFKKIEFEWTHNIGLLIKTLEDNNIEIPDTIKKSASLSLYAVRTRYPGTLEPVTKKEFQEALNMAEDVFNWVKKKLRSKSDPD
ncbi:MAG TPA: HEPN domain-containing protein [Candidatus Deferrimicrobium sp.]|nr:HEPN domain-containing protein [Candidatus Kapabacteria bacterium]HLP57350.1 HEPN domain-containing protein [Candidatus Deferrimicrobium sp.]